MVFSPRKKETRPIPIQIFILTHYQKQKTKKQKTKQNKTKKKKISICNLIYSSIQYLKSPAAIVPALQGLPALFFPSRPTCTSPIVGQRSTQGQGTRGLE